MVPRSPLFRHNTTTLLAQILTLLVAFTFSVHAQSPSQPTIAAQAASAFIDGRGLYVSGGMKPPHSLSSQTFMIDLSVSWSTRSPAYKALAPGPSQLYIPSAISADGKKWFTMAAGLGQVYDIDTDKWTDIFTNKAMERLWGRGAALDPATGLVYMPFAYPNADGSFSMLKVNLKDGSIASDNNSNMLPTVSEYAVAWSTPLKSLVYVIEGGTYTYNSIDGWKSFTAPPNGASPLGSCLVAANGGKQLVLFGGYSKATNVTQSSIYILDVATSTWTTGASAPISNGRHAAACAVSNDYFIAWGGDTAAGTDVVAPENLTIVYNLKTNIWTTEYIGPSGSPDSHTPVNKGVVISVVGLVLLIVVVGSVFIYRRRSRRSVANTLPSMLDPPTPTSPAPHSPTAPPMLPPKNRSRSVKHKPETSSQNTVVEQVLSGENKSEVRLGTVQVGSYGTRPVSQDPGCCNIELIVSQEVEYVTANNNVPKAPVLVLNPPLVQPPTPVQSSLTPPPPVKPPRLARSPSLVKLSPPVGSSSPVRPPSATAPSLVKPPSPTKCPSPRLSPSILLSPPAQSPPPPPVVPSPPSQLAMATPLSTQVKSTTSNFRLTSHLSTSSLLTPPSFLSPHSCRQQLPTESTVTEVIELYYDPQVYQYNVPSQ